MENRKNSNIYNYNKSISNIFINKLSQIERSNSNINSSTSKKTAGFEESLNYLTNVSKKMDSFSNRKKVNNLHFSGNNNVPVHQSQEFSIKDIKDKNDFNGNYTNINISIVNPNFSINNFENNNSGTNRTNKSLNQKIVNDTLVSFKEGENKIKIEENKSISKTDGKTKLVNSIYKDYIENNSNEETFSENFKDEKKKNMFKDYIIKNKIMQYEYKKKSNISGFSAYMFPNEEKKNKDKICLNININKSNTKDDNNKEDFNSNGHIMNFFSLYCGRENNENNENDELISFIKSKLKDNILSDKELINAPRHTIKNSFIKCEIDYIKKFLDENKQKYLEKDKNPDEKIKIPSASIFLLLNIDDIFYIGNIGNTISILSSNYSKKINFLSKENLNKEIYDPNIIDKRKSINSLFNTNNINDENICNFNDLNDKSDIINNSQFLLNSKLINQSSNTINFGLTTTSFIRIFPGKTLYDFFSINNNNNNNNNNNKNNNLDINTNNNNNNKINFVLPTKRESKMKVDRRLSTTFGNLNFMNLNNEKLKNKNFKVNNFFRDNARNSKTRSSINDFDNIFNQNYNKFYRNSFISQSTFNDIFAENKIISSYPDIVSFKYQKNHDFILIGSQIIFEKITFDKICRGIYETMKKCIRKHRSFEMFLGCVVKDIIKTCLSMGITAKISCIFICFEPMKKLYLNQDIIAIKNILVSFYLPLANKNKFEIYDEYLTTDLIDLEKANDYDNIFVREIEKKNKEKNNFNTNIISMSELNTKMNDNSFKKEENKVKNKVKTKKKKCRCLIY